MRTRRILIALAILVAVATGAFATGTTEAPAMGEDVTLRATNYDRGRFPEGQGTMAENSVVDWINEQLPFNVEYVIFPRWEQAELLNAQFAAGDAPDYIFSYEADFNKTKYQEGLTLALDPYLEEYAPNVLNFITEYPAARGVATRDDGQMHYFPIGQEMGPNWTLFVRTDWLDNLGLEIPRTTEELFDVAYAFTYDDPDGNGEDDTLGINLSWIGSLMVDIMFGRTEIDFYEEGNDYVLDWDRLEASTAFKKRLYEAGLVDRDFLTDNNGNKAKQDFITGRLGLYFANNGVRDGNLFLAVMETQPDAEFVPIPFPESEFGSFNPIHDEGFGARSFINSQTDVPEAAVQYGDFMQDYETYLYLSYGVEGETFEYDAQGIPQFTISDEERSSMINWRVDLRNHFPQIQLPSAWNSPETRYLNRGPEWDKVYDAYMMGLEYYLNPNQSYAWKVFTSMSEPVIPADLQLVTASRQEVYDIWTRAIVSGDDLTVGEAREQAEALWASIGGPQLEEFYSEWYAESKDTVLRFNDLYK